MKKATLALSNRRVEVEFYWATEGAVVFPMRDLGPIRVRPTALLAEAGTRAFAQIDAQGWAFMPKIAFEASNQHALDGRNL